MSKHLRQTSLLLSDNAHATGELLDFAQSRGLEFWFFREEPSGHWCTGAGLGAAGDAAALRAAAALKAGGQTL